MWKSRIVLSIVSLLCFSSQAQQLIINEVSQGANAKEYVEFVVIGNPTCQTPVPCIDLRGVIIDDNNGFFAPGAGTGIATGAIRFANISFWSCVPQGTYIVVYNENDANPALPPDDSNLNDGNCRLVIPANSNLLEGTSTSPNTSLATYPAAGWTLGGGTWNQVAMSNNNDSFQIPNLGVNGTPLHSVSWGNNSSGAIIYFAGSASGRVFSFTNNTSNDWNLQANWSSGNVGADETPGAANNAANDAWIASMNPQCGIAAGLQAMVTVTDVTCGGNCNGTATAQATGGTTPYTYLWSNGQTTATISALCSGTYTVTVTDAGGCSTTAQGTVQTNANGIQVSFTNVNESCAGLCNGSSIASASGGSAPYQYAWSNGPLTAANPNLCPGTYTVGVIDQNGCTATGSATITTNANNLQVSFTNVNESCAGLCDGSSIASASGGSAPYQYAWSNGPLTAANPNLCPGTYTVGVIDQNGCTGTGAATISAGAAIGDATIQAAGPFTTNDPAVQLQAASAGGTWLTADCAGCLSVNGLFNPAVSGAGTFQICYSVGSGNCAANDCMDIVVTEGCTPQTTEEIITFCAEDSVLIFGNWENTPDTYSQTYTDINGCDSTHNIVLLVIPIFNNQTVSFLCYGDSVLVFGQWVTEAGDYTQAQQTPQGCNYTFHHIVMNELPQFCENEEFSLFVPNAFTPDGDFINDTFKVELLGATLNEGYIYNRWGNEIKRFDNENREWDGKTTNGEPVQDGVYTYILFYTPTNKVQEMVHGFVTVVR